MMFLVGRPPIFAPLNGSSIRMRLDTVTAPVASSKRAVRVCTPGSSLEAPRKLKPPQPAAEIPSVVLVPFSPEVKSRASPSIDSSAA